MAIAGLEQYRRSGTGAHDVGKFKTDREPGKNYPIAAAIPDEPVVATPKIDVVGPEARRYESRTFANDGVLVVSRQRPPERAVNRTYRPGVDIIEVGEYPTGDYDLINRILDDSEIPILNGVPMPNTDNISLIGRVISSKGVTRIATHEQDERLVELAREWGIDYPENWDIFRSITTKSGLNNALAAYKERHPTANVSAFGRNFKDFGELVTEVDALTKHGFGAYIKMDFAPKGNVNAGGEGQILLPKDSPLEENLGKLHAFIESGHYGQLAPLTGVAQIAIPDPTVFSMSSGQDRNGTYQLYEAHIQTQDGNTAAGAKPLLNDNNTQILIEQVWPDIIRFYEENGIRGRQNMNYICIPEDMLERIRRYYDDTRIEPVVAIDLNYRAISGTLNAMARYQEETGRPVDLTNFRSDGIKVHSFYAANPHLIYAVGRGLGLNSGRGGNFSVINMGTFEPSRLTGQDHFKTQILVSGTLNPERDVQCMREMVYEAPSSSQRSRFTDQGFRYLTQHLASAIDEDSYTEFIRQNLTHLLNGDNPSANNGHYK